MNEKRTKLEQQILKKITPNQQDRKKLKETIQSLKQEVEKETQKQKLPITLELVGSTAKDTYLKNSLDIDLFLVFPLKTPKTTLAQHALSIGQKLLEKTEEGYAEHPYIRGEYKGYKTELVPCYKIESATQKLSAVDRTPLHTQYIQKYIQKSQKDDVRLFKQFLKGIGCYGAEAEVEGFSGYLCEILVLYYKTFNNLLTQAQNWKQKEKLKLNNEKTPEFDTPLTFIDPVDSERNVASAVSQKKYELFKYACKQYLNSPKSTFFFPNNIKPWTLNKIKQHLANRNTVFVGILFPKPNIIAENLYPQLRKALKSITDTSERFDFEIIQTSFHIDIQRNQIVLIFELKNDTLSDTRIHTGPPAILTKNAKEFQAKWKNNKRLVKGPYEQNKRLYAEIKREYSDIYQLLSEEFKNLSLGKHLDITIKNKQKILKQDALIQEKLTTFWTEYLDNKMPWER